MFLNSLSCKIIVNGGEKLMKKEQWYNVRTREGKFIRLYPVEHNQFKVFGDTELQASIDPETKEVKFFAVDKKRKK